MASGLSAIIQALQAAWQKTLWRQTLRQRNLLQRTLRQQNLLQQALWPAAFLLAISSLSLPAQDFVIEEQEQEQEGFTDYWHRHFSLRLGTSYSGSLNDSGYRAYSFTNLTWQHELDWIAFNFNGELYRRDYQYLLIIDDEERANLESELQTAQVTGNIEREKELEQELMDLENNEEIRLTLIENRSLLREANVKLKLSDYLEISGGIHTIVWGQIDLVSPVDFYLPLRFDGGELNFNKTNNRLPQLSGILSIFPFRQVEIIGYYFPRVSLDSSNRRFFEQPRDGLNEETYQIENEFLYPDEDPDQEEAQYAGRLLLYLNWATIGFTYYRGWEQFFEDKNRMLVQRPHSSGEGYIFADPARSTEPVKTDPNYQVYFVEDTPRLRKIDVYGFEIAIPTGQWSWKMDLSYSEGKEIIDIFNIGTFNNVKALQDDGREVLFGFPLSEEEYRAQKAIIDWAKNENNNSLDVITTQTFIGIGVDADLEHWLINLGLFYNYNRPKSKKDERGLELHERLEDIQLVEDEPVVPAVPFFNIGRYLSQDKKDIIGLAGGFFGFGAGAMIYFGQEYFEALQLGISLEFLFLFSSNEVEEAVGGYELRDEVYPALRLLLAYKF